MKRASIIVQAVVLCLGLAYSSSAMGEEVADEGCIRGFGGVGDPRLLGKQPERARKGSSPW